MAKQMIGARPARTTLHRKYASKTEGKYGISESKGWRENGHRDGTVQIFVDLDKIAQLYGRRALDSKRGRAQAMNGCVVVQVVAGSLKDSRPPLVKYLVPVLLNGQEIDGIRVEEPTPEAAKEVASVDFIDRGYRKSTGHTLGHPRAED